MKRRALMLTTVMFAGLLLASGIGTAVAEPQKNQIPVSESEVACTDGVPRAFVINGEGNVGHINDSTSNIIITRSSLTFFDPEDTEMKEPIPGSPVIVDNGKKKGLQGDLITCSGEITTELFRLGEVTVVFEFEGFITPRNNR